MKKDIEWLKEEIGELPCVDTVFNSGGSSYIDSAVPVMAVCDLIDKLDEPEVLSQELPVIPKYVADWFEENREWYENKFFSIGRDLHDNAIHPDVDRWLIENEEKFVRAWLYGFTIASEDEAPLYHALIKGHELLEGDAVKYWATSDYDSEGVFLFYQYPDEYVNTIVKNTKDKWNELGIDDSNADFVKADD